VNKSRRINSAVLSSDDAEIRERATGKVAPWSRPVELAQDETSTEAVLADVLDVPGTWKPDIVVLLQPTSPLRRAEHIDEAIELLERTGADSVVSVSPTHAHLWDADGRPQYAQRRRRQDMAPQYEENGSIYAFTMDHWRRTGNRLGGHVELYVMGEEHRYQVDTPTDLAICELLLERSAVLA